VREVGEQAIIRRRIGELKSTKRSRTKPPAGKTCQNRGGLKAAASNVTVFSFLLTELTELDQLRRKSRKTREKFVEKYTLF